MDMVKTNVAMIVFCAMHVVWLIAGCHDVPSSPEAIRVGVTHVPDHFDPRDATDAISSRINRLLYDRLVDLDARAQPVPALATWEQRTPLRYRFVLRAPRPTFHDGSPLTAWDVKATYESMLDPARLSPHRSTLRVIRQMVVHDEEVIDFVLDHPDPLFPHYLVIGILPANLIAQGHDFRRKPVGSGPFRLERWIDDTRVRLLRRADGQRLDLVRVPDPTVRALKLLAGELDIVQNDLPPELVAYLADDDRLRIMRHHGTNFSYLGFHLQDPVTGQREVRQAIAHAIDREGIIHFVLKDGARLANAVFPPEHWAGHPALNGYPYDPDRARALLAQAGYSPTRPVRITYKTSSDPFRLRLATILQQQLAAVGIDVAIHSHDWGTFYGDIKAGRFQMFSLAWVGVKTPDIFRYAFHSQSVPPHGANRGRLNDARVDALIEQAERANTLQEKQALYRTLQAILLESLPYVPLWYEDHVAIVRREIVGYRLASDGNYDGLRSVRRRGHHATPRPREHGL